MRKILVAVVLIVLLVAVGWLSFHYDGNRASVDFDAAEMREDTKDALKKGEAAVEKATERSKEFIEDARTEDSRTEDTEP